MSDTTFYYLPAPRGIFWSESLKNKDICLIMTYNLFGNIMVLIFLIPWSHFLYLIYTSDETRGETNKT